MSRSLLLFSVFCTFIILTFNQPIFPKKVWVYWQQQIEKAPLFVRLCYQKLSIQCKAENWTLTLLSQKNLPDYIPDYEQRIQKIHKNASHTLIQNFVDFIRIAIVQQQGGVYFDISVILFEGLSWLQNLHNTPYLITNKRKQQPDALFPYITFYQSSTQWRKQDGSVINEQAGYQNWFIAGKAHSPVLKDWRKTFQYFYQQKTQEVQKVLKQKQIFIRCIERSSYLIGDKSMYFFNQRKQFQLDKSLTLFSQRKYASEYYKLWSFKSEIGPYAFQILEIPKRFYHLFDKTVEEIQKQYLNIRFFIKLTGYGRSDFQQLLKFQLQLSRKGSNFQKFLQAKPSYEQCQRNLFPVKGSLVGSLIQGNPLAQQMGFFQISLQQRSQLQKYCKEKEQQKSRNNTLSDNLAFYWQVIYHETLVPSIIKMMAKIEQNRIYSQDLGFSQKVKIYFKLKFLRILIFLMGVIFIFYIFLNAANFISKKILRYVKAQNRSNEYIRDSQTKYINCNNDYFTTILGYLYIFIALCVLNQYAMYEAGGDLKQDNLLILLVLSYMLVNRNLDKEINKTNKILILFKYDIRELKNVFDPLVFFFLGKMLLNWTEVRPDQIFSDSIIICLMLPYLFKSLKYTNLFRSNSLKKRLNTLQTVHYVALISFIFICRFSNLRYMIIGEKYLLTVIPPLLVYYTMFFFILRVLAAIYEIVKKNNQSHENSNMFVFTVIKQLIEFGVLAYVFHLSYHFKELIDYLEHPFNRFHGSLMFMIFFIYSEFKFNKITSDSQLQVSSEGTTPNVMLCEIILFYIIPTYLLYIVAYEKQKIMVSYQKISLFLVVSSSALLTVYRYKQSFSKKGQTYSQIEMYSGKNQISSIQTSENFQ